ncbi:MAG: hypothetical protein J0M29_08440 [Chitinophagales bacterium]|nr:hypothetical protein [Chitinophagales bacterium]
MNNKSIVKLSNAIGLASIILLVYWVFILICTTVFKLQILGENLSQNFYLSLVGILALMLGSLFVNIMFNLTRIAEKHNQDHLQESEKVSKRPLQVLGLSFILVLCLMLGGDYLTSREKERMLISSAKSIIENNPEQSDKLLHFSYTNQWINETSDILEIYSRTDNHFPFVTVVVADTMLSSRVYLGFNKHLRNSGDLTPKTRFIQTTNQEEREYLDKVFLQNLNEIRFTAEDGHYELFYPYRKDNKCIVLHFSESPRFSRQLNK